MKKIKEPEEKKIKKRIKVIQAFHQIYKSGWRDGFDYALKQETKNKILKIIYEAEWWRLGKKEFEKLIQKIKEV